MRSVMSWRGCSVQAAWSIFIVQTRWVANAADCGERGQCRLYLPKRLKLWCILLRSLSLCACTCLYAHAPPHVCVCACTCLYAHAPTHVCVCVFASVCPRAFQVWHEEENHRHRRGQRKSNYEKDELASCDQLFSSFRCCIFTYILCHSGCLWLSFSLLLVPTLSSFYVYLTCFKQENRKLVYFLFSRMQHLCFLSKPEQRISSGRPSVTCGGISRWTWAALAGDGLFVTVLTRWLLAELQNSFDDRMTSFEGPTARYTRVISLGNDHNAYLSLMQAISEEESNWLPCAQADERQARMRLVVLKQFFFSWNIFFLRSLLVPAAAGCGETRANLENSHNEIKIGASVRFSSSAFHHTEFEINIRYLYFFFLTTAINSRTGLFCRSAIIRAPSVITCRSRESHVRVAWSNFAAAAVSCCDDKLCSSWNCMAVRAFCSSFRISPQHNE